jgi:serine/threonine protein kinase
LGSETHTVEKNIYYGRVCGQPLFVWLCETPSYSESRVCGYMVQLLSALAYLHSASILHLDIRPENLLLEADNSTLKLIGRTGETALIYFLD